MSSISRARSSASAHAAAGVWATSGVPLAPWSSGDWPIGDKSREQKPPFESAERLRQSERLGGDVAGRGFGECDFVLVDVADGDDARQDGGVAFSRIEKSVAHQPAGAARRQINRRRGQRERIVGNGEAEPAAVQCLDQRRQKRRRRRYGEDTRVHGGDLIGAVAGTTIWFEYQIPGYRF